MPWLRVVTNGFQSMVWGPLWTLRALQGSLPSQNYSHYNTNMFSPFSLSFSHKCTMEFSRSFLICDDIITVKANGMWAFVVLCLKVLFLVSNVANMNSYNPYKQQIFGVLNNFLKCIGALWTEYLRTAGLTWSLFIFGHM